MQQGINTGEAERPETSTPTEKTGNRSESPPCATYLPHQKHTTRTIKEIYNPPPPTPAQLLAWTDSLKFNQATALDLPSGRVSFLRDAVCFLSVTSPRGLMARVRNTAAKRIVEVGFAELINALSQFPVVNE